MKIQDPIHGSIFISELERKLIDSAAFQRLKNIKQLGNVYQVFPGATHTRASHSIGVMHVAGLLFDSIFEKAFKSENPGVLDAIKSIRKIVRLAGLLHDLGHGPYSHLFEHVYMTAQVSELSADLKVPDSWLKAKFRESYFDSKLEHENYSYAMISWLSNNLKVTIPAQDICSLLDDRFDCSKEFMKELEVITTEVYGCDSLDSLKQCLKSILSGEIDADRIDYLQRDSLFCGIKISSIDVSHILSSIKLKVYSSTVDDGEKKFCIRVDPNAIASIEQILVFRKKMFDQVYSHRVNASFDNIMGNLFQKLLKRATPKIVVPKTYSEFLEYDDRKIDSILNMLIYNRIVNPNNEEDLLAKLLVTRSLLKKLYEKTVSLEEVAETVSEFKSLTFEGYTGKKIVTKIKLKELTKLSRFSGTKNNSVLRVFKRVPDGDIVSTPLNQVSEILRSTAWLEEKVKVVVFKGYEESANERMLSEKLETIPIFGEEEVGEEPTQDQSLLGKSS